MGNKHTVSDHSDRFTENELRVIKETFKELAKKGGHETYIDKATFLKFFPLPGLLGERLFAVFDSSHTAKIDLEKFIFGLSVCCRGDFKEKSEFLFHLYDVAGENSVGQAELSQMLYHIPKNFGRKDERPNGGRNSLDERGEDEAAIHTEVVKSMVDKAFEECDLDHDGKLTLEQFQAWLSLTPEIATFLDNIFPYFEDADAIATHAHNARDTASPSPPLVEDRKADEPEERPTSGAANSIKNFNQRNSRTSWSRMGGLRNGSVTMSLGLYGAKHSPVPSPVPSSPKQLPQMRHTNSFHNSKDSETDFGLVKKKRIIGAIGTEFRKEYYLSCRNCSTEFRYSICCGTEYSKATVGDFRPSDASWTIKCAKCNESVHFACCGICGCRFSSEAYGSYVAPVGPDKHSVAAMSGYLAKIGKFLKVVKKRWYILQESMLYAYADSDDLVPKHVMFLDGCYIDVVHDPPKEAENLWAFNIVEQNCSSGAASRTLYASSKEERENWVTALRKAAQVKPIEVDYEIGKQLGEGRFSIVKSCIHKKSGIERAVKIIDKDVMEPEEKELMRTEISILKLVHHKNIIRMIDVFEDRVHIYIVMEMVKGGELFDRIVGRSVMDEAEACSVVEPLAESVSYLHKLGIIHRDLKPENILCGEKLADVKIADFGLSKLILPGETCHLPCGTLSYVAPEVVSNKGYSNSADLWSLGVIMYLLLRGKLPFKAPTRDEVIFKISRGVTDIDDVDFKASPECKDALHGLLNSNAAERLTADQLLQHPWIKKYSSKIPEIPKAPDSPRVDEES